MLSNRQLELLQYIIKDYIESSEPVGSTYLVQKYNLKYSAATVRNEMARLLELGFLDMMHTSSGRVPTSMAYKFFLNEIAEEGELPVLQEVAIKQRLWPQRYEFYRLLKEVVLSLADVTKQLAMATTDNEQIISAGAANILENKEFWDIDAAKAALSFPDRYDLLQEVFNKVETAHGNVYCVIGADLRSEHLSNACLLFSSYKVGDKTGYLSVLGPSRMRYENIIPALRYTANLVHELGSW